MSEQTADTFVRIARGGSEAAVPIARLDVCGIGRAPSNAVVLDDSMASREHAIIRRNATGHCVISDLGSTNGTRVNARMIAAPTALISGDLVQIGRATIEFVQSEPPQAIADAKTVRTQFLLEQQLVSCLVIDVRGFTQLSALWGEKRTAEVMSFIFREADALLQLHGCWSTKFIGDSIMAIWAHPANSISRAELVQIFDVISGYQQIFALAQAQVETGALRFGCGLNAGMASIGNVGSATATDFTAMGEAVNIAFRLESATRDYGCDVMIARRLFECLGDCRYMPATTIAAQLKGYGEALPAVPLSFAAMGALVGDLLEA